MFDKDLIECIKRKIGTAGYSSQIYLRNLLITFLHGNDCVMAEKCHKMIQGCDVRFINQFNVRLSQVVQMWAVLTNYETRNISNKYFDTMKAKVNRFGKTQLNINNNNENNNGNDNFGLKHLEFELNNFNMTNRTFSRQFQMCLMDFQIKYDQKPVQQKCYFVSKRREHCHLHTNEFNKRIETNIIHQILKYY